MCVSGVSWIHLGRIDAHSKCECNRKKGLTKMSRAIHLVYNLLIGITSYDRMESVPLRGKCTFQNVIR